MNKTSPIITLAALLLGTPLLADFGMKFTSDQVKAVRLDQEKAQLSFRFQAPFDTDLQAIALHCREAQDPPAYLVSVFKDKNGKPHGLSMGDASLVPKANTWSLMTLDEESLPIVADQSYHLLIRWDEKRGGKHKVGTIGPDNWASFTATTGTNEFYPYDEKPNTGSTVLFGKSKRKLKSLGLQPVFLAEGRGRRYFGNSYTHSLARSIHGNGTPEDISDDVWQAQILHFHCGTISTDVNLRLRKIGNPKTGLKMDVLRHDYKKHKVIHKFTLDVSTETLTSKEWSWVKVVLPKKTGRSFSPDCQYFALHTTAGSGGPGNSNKDCKNCYQISGSSADRGLTGAQDITFDGAAHQSRATWSRAGTHWIDNFNEDLNIYVQSKPCSGAHLPLTPIPTPARPLGGRP